MTTALVLLACWAISLAVFMGYVINLRGTRGIYES